MGIGSVKDLKTLATYLLSTYRRRKRGPSNDDEQSAWLIDVLIANQSMDDGLGADYEDPSRISARKPAW